MKAAGKLERQCDEEGLFPIIQQNSVRLLFLGALKSLQMVIAAMKLKEASFLDGSYDQPR